WIWSPVNYYRMGPLVLFYIFPIFYAKSNLSTYVWTAEDSELESPNLQPSKYMAPQFFWVSSAASLPSFNLFRCLSARL
ncbi:hypothetical protein B0H10DRAFT_1996657, partial [Mycena sp. CBHHK59/15]